MWVLVDKYALPENRVFIAYGAGWLMPENPGKHVGTAQIHGGTAVFHVFDATGCA